MCMSLEAVQVTINAVCQVRKFQRKVRVSFLPLTFPHRERPLVACKLRGLLPSAWIAKKNRF